MQQHWDTVAIIGVGLIGGSIGLAVRERKLARRVVGIGRRASSLQSAMAHGCVTETATTIADGVKDASLIVVCTPVDAIAEHVVEASEHCNGECILTDAGSTKGLIVSKIEAALKARFGNRLPFVGSHPLAGSEKNGPQAAAADLFVDRIVVVTETESSSTNAVDAIEA